MGRLDLFNETNDEESIDSKYTTKVLIPQYLPKDKCPSIEELVDKTKFLELIRKINASSVSDEEKEFLKFSAYRHLVFNYSKIADYYAHASKEMQELMEESALVIIDLNDAIANGYVKMSKTIENIMNTSGTKVKEEYYNQSTGKKND